MYEITFTPRISEVDETEKVKITAMMDYLQHIAYKHADLLGVGHHQIFHKNLTWLLLRYTIKIIRYPTPDEELSVSSWVAESGSPKYTVRDFEIKDGEKNVICQATTSWLLYNYRKRKSLNFRDYWSDFKAEERRAIDYRFPNLPLPNNITSRKQLRVRLQDLDINQHVNHVAHIYWIIEAMPDRIRKKFKIEQIEISYKEQAFHEEDISIETEIIEDKKSKTLKAIHQIANNKNKLVSKAITFWKAIH